MLRFLEYFQKSRVDLSISNAEFIAKGFDHNYIGYQLQASVTNKGKKICLDLDDVSVVMKDTEGNSPSLLKVVKKLTDNHGEITLDEEQIRDIRHCWIDKKDHISTSLGKLKQDDLYYLVYPCETGWGGLVGSREKNSLSSSYSSEYLLDLKNEEYVVEITLKGEDSDKNTILKKETFKIKPPVNKFTTTKDTEIGGLKSQINQLQNNVYQNESKVSTLTTQITKLEKTIAERDSTILKKDSETQQLSSQVGILESQLAQAEIKINRLNSDINDQKKEIAWLRNPPKEKLVK